MHQMPLFKCLTMLYTHVAAFDNVYHTAPVNH